GHVHATPTLAGRRHAEHARGAGRRGRTRRGHGSAPAAGTHGPGHRRDGGAAEEGLTMTEERRAQDRAALLAWRRSHVAGAVPEPKPEHTTARAHPCPF